jgi:hypothetical protein
MQRNWVGVERIDTGTRMHLYQEKVAEKGLSSKILDLFLSIFYFGSLKLVDTVR